MKNSTRGLTIGALFLAVIFVLIMALFFVDYEDKTSQCESVGHDFKEGDNCAVCGANIRNVSEITIDMSATYSDNVVGYAVPNISENIYDVYIKGNGAMIDYINSESPFKEVSVVSVYIDSGVTTLGANVFNGQSRLTTITFAEDSQLVSVGIGAFGFCTSLKNVTLPNRVEVVELCSFMECTSLESIVLPEGLKNLSPHAFGRCTELKSITIPNSVTKIDNTAFSACTGLEAVEFAEGSKLETIGAFAFSFCLNLESVVIPNGVLEIGSYAFDACDNLKSVTIPGSVNEFGYGVFRSCERLQEVVLSEGMKIIPVEAFSGCVGLKTIVIPDSVTAIEEYAFSGCKGLESVVFGEKSKLETIGKSAFSSCKKLERIVIPDGTTTIESYAFAYCDDLISVVIPDSVAYMQERVFSGSYGTKIYCHSQEHPTEWSANWRADIEFVYWAERWEFDGDGNPVVKG